MRTPQLRSTSSWIAVLGVALTLAGNARLGAAQVVNIDSLNGVVISTLNPAYNRFREELTFFVVVDVPNTDDYFLNVNNRGFSLAALQANGIVATIPVGDGCARWWTDLGYNTCWPPSQIYLPWLADPERVLIPVLAELNFDDPATPESDPVVVSRSHAVLFDERLGHFRANQGATTTKGGMGHWLAPDAWRFLEPTHVSTLPMPGLPEFNSLLSENTRGTARGNAPDSACFRMNERPDLEQLPSVQEIYASASRQYIAYLAAQAAQDLARPLTSTVPFLGFAINQVQNVAFCVQEEPKPEDFEFCVHQIDATLDSLEIGEVTNVFLRLRTTPHKLGAAVWISGVDGLMNATLSAFHVEYAEGSELCVTRPQADVSEQEMDDFGPPGWRVCDDVRFHAGGATTPDGLPESGFGFDFGVTADSPERFFFRQSESHGFVIRDLAPDLGSQTCAQPFISSDVAETILGFENEVASALAVAWEAPPNRTEAAGTSAAVVANAPPTEPTGLDSQQAEALTLLFDRHSPELSVESLYYTAELDLGGLDSERDLGIVSIWDSEATGDFASKGATAMPNPADIFSPFSAVTSTPNGLVDPWGISFQGAISISTAHLNQILRELHYSPTLTFRFHPTYDDFGIDGSTGEPRLTGTFLAEYLFWAFGDAGGSEIYIDFRPLFPPFTTMRVDPTLSTPLGEAPVHLHYGQVVITFASEDPDGNEVVWLEVVADYHNGDFQLDLSNDVDGAAGSGNEPGLLIPSLPESSELASMVITKSLLTSCPLLSHLVSTPDDCGVELGRAVSDLLMPVLRESLLEALSDIEVAQYYDADGITRLPTERALLEPTNKWRDGQQIELYGTFQSIPVSQ